jgi:pantothenate kinase-related protein Tda10
MNPSDLLVCHNKWHKTLDWENKLCWLSWMEHENEPLIPFLTGAGGSGKSEVINNFL